ncbi:hypothetical protein HYY75_06410 [bacterium]|nr:hypothetical protein [bacterium]
MGMWTIPETPPKDEKFSAEEIDSFIQTFAKEIVRRKMSVPAVIALEMAKPLSFLGHSACVVMGPLIEMVFDPKKIEKMTSILSERCHIERLLETIETMENSVEKAGG